MITTPLAPLPYVLEQQLSSGPLTANWLGLNPQSGAKRFLKISRPDTALPVAETRSILINSYRHQQLLISPVVNSALALWECNDSVAVEYPYLSPDDWRPLDLRIFWSDPVGHLLAVCRLLDFVHWHGLVHRDFKWENVLINQQVSPVRWKLVDLDTLAEAGSRPLGRWCGTPGLIAPEIANNDIIVVQSDNYSLGILLQRALKEAPCEVADGLLSAVDKFATSLITPIHTARPMDLLATLHEAGVVSQEQYSSESRSLFLLILQGEYRKYRRENPSVSLDSLCHFVYQQCRIVGISKHLLATAHQVVSAKQVRPWRNGVRELLNHADVRRTGIHWQLTLTDDSLLNVYDCLTAGSADDGTRTAQTQSDDGDWLEVNYLRQARELKRRINPQSQESLPEFSQIEKVAIMARRLYRLADATQFYELAISQSNDVVRSCEALLRLTVIALKSHDLDRAERHAKKGIKLAQDSSSRELTWQFCRTLAWIKAQRGVIDEAKADFRRLIEEVGTASPGVISRAQYSLGIISWRNGDFVESRTLLENARDTARKANLATEILAPLSALSLLAAESGRYLEAVSLGEEVVKLAETQIDLSILPSACINLAFAYSGLGQYTLAQFYNNLYRDLVASTNAPADLQISYQVDGFLSLCQGRLYEAEHMSAHALFHSTGTPRKQAGKAHQVLACCALLRGNLEALSLHAEKAIEVYQKIGDATSTLEINLIQQLSDLCYSNEAFDPRALRDTIEQLLKRKSLSYVRMGLIHAGIADVFDDKSVFRTLCEQTEPDGHRHLDALDRNLKILSAEFESDAGKLVALKNVLTKLTDPGNKFLSLRACNRIGELYCCMNKPQHAKKFFRQALNNAIELSNPLLISAIEANIHNCALSTDTSRLIGVMYSISEMLARADDQQKFLEELISFAIEQTGAERGAILLPSGTGLGLRVAAARSCDDESLKDIVNFSTNTVRSVAQADVPVIIENALEDERTRGLPSIAMHNILSVAALPIHHGGEMLGVIYLDHHTIPGLFGQEDIEYIGAIANFAGTSLRHTGEFRSLVFRTAAMGERLGQLGVANEIVTKNVAMHCLLEQLDKVAATDATVLIEGETGTGKELVCAYIHKHSSRSQLPLITLDCSAISPTIIEAELFGVARGAATGVIERAGKLTAADGGTLFLDEIGDLPVELQTKLLRAIESQQFEPVGSNRTKYTDIRFVAATNRNLKVAIQEGKFRQDLYYRVNTISITVPPLRDRKDDIPLLLQHFARIFGTPGSALNLSSKAMDVLISYDWPGNIRQLRNLVERLVILHAGERITPDMLPEEVRAASPVTTVDTVSGIERARIVDALLKTGGNRSEAARRLRMPRSTLRHKILKYKITSPVTETPPGHWQ